MLSGCTITLGVRVLYSFKRFHAVEEVKNLSPRLPKPDVFPEEAQLPLYIITRSAQPRLWLDECEGVTNENDMGDKEPLPGWVAEFVDSASVPACFMEDWLRHFTADTRSFASKGDHEHVLTYSGFISA
jgi:hypothetical protein